MDINKLSSNDKIFIDVSQPLVLELFQILNYVQLKMHSLPM